MDKRKELIDFLEWMELNTAYSPLAEPKYYADRYIKETSPPVKEVEEIERTTTRLALVTIIRILQRRVNTKAADFSDNELKLFDGAKKILSKYQKPEDILR